MNELSNVMLQQKMNERLLEQKIQCYIELVRRKLDVEIIKDNAHNEKTQEILDKFASETHGRNTVNFKSRKFKDLLSKREAQVAKLNEVKLLNDQYKEALSHSKTKLE